MLDQVLFTQLDSGVPISNIVLPDTQSMFLRPVMRNRSFLKLSENQAEGCSGFIYIHGVIFPKLS